MFGRDCGVRMHSNLMNTANTSTMRNRRAKNLGVFPSQRNWSGWMTARWVSQFDLVLEFILKTSWQDNSINVVATPVQEKMASIFCIR